VHGIFAPYFMAQGIRQGSSSSPLLHGMVLLYPDKSILPNAGPNGEGSHVMHSHHEGPYSVSYTETMQQPLSPMVVGPDMQQQNKEHHQMASHLNLHGDNGVHG